MTEYSIDLPDGRKMGFTEYGDPQGTPVFYFHGTPGSRLEAGRFHEIATAQHCRLIGIDRPGMGNSTFDPERTLLSWPKDVSHVADYLSIKKFSLIGHSGGAPYVAACAYAIPERLNSVAIVSGMGPFERPEAQIGLARSQKIVNQLIRFIPPSADLMMWLTNKMLENPDKLFQHMVKQLPKPDQIIFSDPSEKAALISGAREAFKNGSKGPAYEMKLLLRPWGFRPEDIRVPFFIWYGALDKQAPKSCAELYAKLIPNAQLNVLDNEGHISILKNHMDDILRNLGI
ncbi:MAG TPA: alpha/beta hydrolase [Gammaproteobacteria bacterium]|nr:alpha/beta hydrolase [Gammaproteobacteria bacterium]